MGPKKKDTKDKKDASKKKTDTKKLPEFPTKNISALRTQAKDRTCFSLIIQPDQAELKVKPGTKTSAPELTVIQPKIEWPPLDEYLPVYNYEIPRITIWEPFTEEHLENWKYLNKEEILLLIESLIPPCYTELNIQFTKTMIYTVLRWTRKNQWDDKKTSSLLGMFLNTHKYFLGSTRRNQKEAYEFFKESILLHTIDDPPKSARILEPLECKSGLLYFCHMYLSILPQLRVQLLPNYQMQLFLPDPGNVAVPPLLETKKKEQGQNKKSFK